MCKQNLLLGFLVDSCNGLLSFCLCSSAFALFLIYSFAFFLSLFDFDSIQHLDYMVYVVSCVPLTSLFGWSCFVSFLRKLFIDFVETFFLFLCCFQIFANFNSMLLLFLNWFLITHLPLSLSLSVFLGFFYYVYIWFDLLRFLFLLLNGSKFEVLPFCTVVLDFVCVFAYARSVHGLLARRFSQRNAVRFVSVTSCDFLSFLLCWYLYDVVNVFFALVFFDI